MSNEGDKVSDRSTTMGAGKDSEPIAPPLSFGTATVNSENPWPGLLAFREADQQYFAGRFTESEDLFRLVMRERLTVLFGLSGLGKSSLLQAGLFPRLRPENAFPVYVRLDFSGDTSLIAQVKSAVLIQAGLANIEAPAAEPWETLWEYFHRQDNDFWNSRNRPVVPLIVFDQFEEVFTLGKQDPVRVEATVGLLEQLSDLAEGRVPTALKASLDEHPEETRKFSFTRHNYKLLLSVREDLLPELEGLRERMPSIVLNRLRLQRMNGSAALQAVAQAKHLIDSHVAERIVRFVAADHSRAPLDTLEVEPALLSVVCRELNDKRQKLNEPKISESLLEGSQDQILSDFYERTVGDLPVEVRSFIEDHLLTVSGYRDSIAVENALSLPGVTSESVDKLVERRLLRREDRGGVQRLELTHDLLTGVVRASGIRRRQDEEAEKSRLAALEQRRLAAERETARRRRLRQTQWVAGVMTLLAAASMLLTVVVIKEKEHAESNLRLAKRAVDESLSSASPQQAQGAGDSPEMEEFRKELLDKAERFYLVLAEKEPKSEVLRSEVASAHSRLGDIKRLMNMHDEAAREYKTAISLFEGLVKERPRNKDYHRALAYAHSFLGETLRTWCEELRFAAPCSLAEAEKEYDSALTLQQELHQEDSGNPLYQQELARTHYNRGIIRYDAGNIAGAESDFRNAIGLLTPLANNPAPTAGDRSTADPSQELARACNDLAVITSRTNPKEAEKLYQQAISLIEGLSRKEPENRRYRLETAKYYNNLAILQMTMKAFAKAKENNHQAVHLIENLLIPSPSISEELVKGQQLSIEISKAQGSTVNQQELDRLFATLKHSGISQRSREHPFLHVVYMNLAKSYISLANNNLKAGDKRGAVAALEGLVQVLPELSDADREALAESYVDLQRAVQGTTPHRPNKQ